MTKKQTKIAKELFKKSLDQKGFISQNRIHQILTATARIRPQGLADILKAYKRLVAAQLKKEEVEVETAQNFKSTKLEKSILAKTGTKRVFFKTAPSLVLGAKITHGDWVWDASLDAKLGQLTTDI